MSNLKPNLRARAPACLHESPGMKIGNLSLKLYGEKNENSYAKTLSLLERLMLDGLLTKTGRGEYVLSPLESHARTALDRRNAEAADVPPTRPTSRTSQIKADTETRTLCAALLMLVPAENRGLAGIFLDELTRALNDRRAVKSPTQPVYTGTMMSEPHVVRYVASLLLRETTRAVSKILEKNGPETLPKLREMLLAAGAVKGANLGLDTMQDGDDACVAWYAGQFLDIVDTNSLFAVNSWINATERFAPAKALT